jgi:hypothetical protein
MQGKLTTGATPSPSATGEGAFVCRQKVTIPFDATLVQNGTLNIPVGSDIVDILVDNDTVFNSATSATVSVGVSTGDTTYASGVSAKAAGRVRPTFTSAQVAALRNIASGTLVATVTSVGQPAAGSITVTILYEPANN